MIVALGVWTQGNLRGILALGARTLSDLQGIVRIELRGPAACGRRVIASNLRAASMFENRVCLLYGMGASVKSESLEPLK